MNNNGQFPNVSIVVPAYNAEESIEACVESLVNQQYPQNKIEIVVVDNRSTDQTQARLHHFGQNIRIVQERNRGAAAARNSGIRNTNSNILAFMDADCVADSLWLYHLIRPLTSPEVGLTAGFVTATKPDHPIQKFGMKIHNTGQAITGLNIPYAAGANIAARRNVLEEVSFYNEKCRFGQDVDISWRILQKGYELIYVPDAVVYHNHEETLKGLFTEGFHHGLAGIHTSKLHRTYLKKLGHKRNQFSSTKRMFCALQGVTRRYSRQSNTCIFAHEAGKTLGKLAGSFKHRYLDF